MTDRTTIAVGDLVRHVLGGRSEPGNTPAAVLAIDAVPQMTDKQNLPMAWIRYCTEYGRARYRTAHVFELELVEAGPPLGVLTVEDLARVTTAATLSALQSVRHNLALFRPAVEFSKWLDAEIESLTPEPRSGTGGGG